MKSSHLSGLATLALAGALLAAGCERAAEAPAAEAASPTDLAAALTGAAAARDAQAVRDLLAQGADPDAAQADGTTALVTAIQGRDHATMTALLEAGADVRRANRYGADAMYVAATNGDADAVRALLAAGADPRAALPEGQTALMTAARTGRAEVIAVLLEAGADGYEVDVDVHEGFLGQTALMWATAAGHVEAMRALIAAGANVDEHSWLIAAPEIAGDRSMGASWSQIPKGRLTALHFAAREGQLEAARTLVAAGADLNITDEYGSTPLILATVNGHLDVAGALLEAGADPKIADEWGRTAIFAATDLHTLDALARAHPRPDDALTPVDIVRLALEKGADPNVALTKTLPDWIVVGGAHSPILRTGSTPLLRAAMSGDLAIMELLLAAGANPTLATELRETNDAKGGGGMGDYGSGGTTPFLAAAGLGWRQTVSRGREEDAILALQLLMELGADVNQTNQAGDTALHGATYRGSLAIMEFLLDHGADPTAKNLTGWTPLDIALGQPDPSYRIAPNPEAAALLRGHTRS
jgi:ankyrin repeat protein